MVVRLRGGLERDEVTVFCLWSRHGVACTLSSLLHVVLVYFGVVVFWIRPPRRDLRSQVTFLRLFVKPLKSRCSPSSLVRPAVTSHHDRPIPAILGRTKHTPWLRRACAPHFRLRAAEWPNDPICRKSSHSPCPPLVARQVLLRSRPVRRSRSRSVRTS